MGLDTGMDMRIPRKDKRGFANLTLFYFRKCYSISLVLRDLTLKYKQFDEKLEYDGEYGIKIKLNKEENIEAVKSMLIEMKEIFVSEVYHYLTTANEIDSNNNDFDFTSFWSLGEYIPQINSAALQVSSTEKFLNREIFFETLAEICRGTKTDNVEDVIDNPEEFDFDNIIIEFYYSY